ncbi:MAG: integrase core domain-containing protein [Candidatus Nomurabacteria bacterium]|nr:integrase core domain-containing protein [Candidatus Nomurabacteria bacterium]
MAYTTNEKVGKVRILAVRMVLSGKSTREVARYFGYNQSTIVRWYKRRNEVWHKRDELPTRSSRPRTSPKRINREIEAKIISVRKETKRCSEVVYESLKQENINVSLSTVKRVLKRYGCLKERSRWKKRRIYPIRPDIEKQGDLVEFDTIHFVDKFNVRSYVYTALDVYSRYGYAMLSKKSNTYRSLLFLKKVKEYFSFEINCIQTDNGPEFGKFFTNNCHIKHRHNHPRSPNENGHLERFNRTLQEEIPKHNLCIFNKDDILKFLKHYNTKRMHMGIKFKTPQQMLN